MSESTLISTTNLEPDSLVPQSGKYKCEFCGQGGIADMMGHLLSGSGLPTAKFEGLGRQQSVRFFEAGRRFTQCPNCGPATGWTLIEDGSASVPTAHPHHDEVVLESGVCDVCCRKVSSPDGYLLTTKEVVSTSDYWKYYFQAHKGEFSSAGVFSYEDFRRNALLRTTCGEAMARQSTPWMVCEDCIRLFAVDRLSHRDYARQWWQSKRTFSPPGNGPAPLFAVNMDDSRVMFSSGQRQESPSATTGSKWWEFWRR